MNVPSSFWAIDMARLMTSRLVFPVKTTSTMPSTWDARIGVSGATRIADESISTYSYAAATSLMKSRTAPSRRAAGACPLRPSIARRHEIERAMIDALDDILDFDPTLEVVNHTLLVLCSEEPMELGVADRAIDEKYLLRFAGREHAGERGDDARLSLPLDRAREENDARFLALHLRVDGVLEIEERIAGNCSSMPAMRSGLVLETGGRAL